jgi:hypothetical protein
MPESVFNSQNVITEHISNADLRAYFVGFDFGQYRYDHLVDRIMKAIVDFSFGFHEGILTKYDDEKLRQAACMVYKIEPYDEKNPNCIEEYPKKHHKAGQLKYKDENEWFDKVYSKRGEFGELILHLLLRDFLNTKPLISKIHLKDSPNIPAHGFDSVHIGKSLLDDTKKSLYLGESKLEITGEKAIDDLLGDIKNPFCKRFFSHTNWRICNNW